MVTVSAAAGAAVATLAATAPAVTSPPITAVDVTPLISFLNMALSPVVTALRVVS